MAILVVSIRSIAASAFKQMRALLLLAVAVAYQSAHSRPQHSNSTQSRPQHSNVSWHGRMNACWHVSIRSFAASAFKLPWHYAIKYLDYCLNPLYRGLCFQTLFMSETDAPLDF